MQWTFAAQPLNATGVTLPPPPYSVLSPAPGTVAAAGTPTGVSLMGPPRHVDGLLVLGVSYEVGRGEMGRGEGEGRFARVCVCVCACSCA